MIARLAGVPCTQGCTIQSEVDCQSGSEDWAKEINRSRVSNRFISVPPAPKRRLTTHPVVEGSKVGFSRNDSRSTVGGWGIVAATKWHAVSHLSVATFKNGASLATNRICALRKACTIEVSMPSNSGAITKAISHGDASSIQSSWVVFQHGVICEATWWTSNGERSNPRASAHAAMDGSSGMRTWCPERTRSLARE